MHIAIVDVNPAAVQAVRLAKEAGHRVTFLQPALTQYALTGETLKAVQAVDRLIDGIDTTDPVAVREALEDCHAESPIDVAVTFQELAAEAVAASCGSLGLRGTAPVGFSSIRLWSGSVRFCLIRSGAGARGRQPSGWAASRSPSRSSYAAAGPSASSRCLAQAW